MRKKLKGSGILRQLESFGVTKAQTTSNDPSESEYNLCKFLII